MTRKVIIQASSQSHGNTYKVVQYLNNFDVIDISTLTIGHFSYTFKNADDDFLPLLENMIASYDTIIFATPVYWYTMSGILKVFFDRLSDLLHYKKELGHQLRGKAMAMVSNSSENDRRSEFNMPFIKSAEYLGMTYLGDTHAWFSGNDISKEAKEHLNLFKKKL